MVTFTKEQISLIRAKVKSGSDFPRVIQEFKSIGILRYEFMVSDGTCIYYGTQGFFLREKSNFANMRIIKESSIDKLKHSLKIHQAGKTDFMTFCKQAAESGVYKWVTDLQNMAVVYYDTDGNEMLAENIPEIN